MEKASVRHAYVEGLGCDRPNAVYGEASDYLLFCKAVVIDCHVSVAVANGCHVV